MRKVPENNSFKKEIEEIVKLCEEAIPEYGEKASFFNEGASEEEMKQWEENNEIRIPESYKEWLRFSVDCQIRQNLAGFYFPRFSGIVPSDLVIIGWLIGDGELLCFSKENGNFIRCLKKKVKFQKKRRIYSWNLWKMLRKEKEKVWKIKIVLFTDGDINLEVSNILSSGELDGTFVGFSDKSSGEKN